MQDKWTMALALALRRIASEDEVSRFSLLMTGEAGLHKRRVGRLAIGGEMPETPSAGCGVLDRVLHHKLNVRGGARNERLSLSEDLVVFLGWHMVVMQSGNDRPVGKRELPFPVRIDRYIVAQDRAKTFQIAFLMG